MLFSLSINYDGAYCWAGFKAKKEQLHYYQAKGIEPLSIEKLQALQLIALYRFYHKQWSETLDVPRKPEPGKDTFQYHVLPFDSIDIISKRRQSLRINGVSKIAKVIVP